MTTEEKQAKLKAIADRVNKCQLCPLYKTAHRGVPGEGDPDSKIMFIGEGPGYHEDQQGRPFVGAAGKLLDQSLAAIGLTREQVFIANVVKHRPPENRDPEPGEIGACQPYLDDQIRIIQPRLIATLGRFSMNKFLPGVYISQVHGQARFVDFLGKKYTVLPLYHPAAALRSGQMMASFREDFAKIPGLLTEASSPPVPEPEPAETQPADSEQLSLI